MRPSSISTRILVAMLTVWGIQIVSPLPSAHADLVKLKTGGELRGKLSGDYTRFGKDDITIETLTGAVIVVQREQLSFVTRRSMKIEEYETKARFVKDTAEAHWDLVNWCKAQRLSAQAQDHLEKVVEFDPSHEQAHRLLGHVQYKGEWMHKDKAMEAQGYVRHRGKYITLHEKELMEKTQEDLEKEREWFQKVRLWHNWLTGRNPDRAQQAYKELLSIKNPDAVVALMRNMQDDDDRRIRQLYIKILGQIPSTKVVSPLVAQSLNDVDQEIRYQALTTIAEDHYPHAIPLFVKALKSDINTIVVRAGLGLQQVADEEAVPYLIDALITTHRYKVWVNDPSANHSFSTNGSFGSAAQQPTLPPEIEAMLRTGQLPHGVIVNNPSATTFKKKKQVVIKHNHQNQSVLAALQKLTGENFGYDERTWKLWYAAKKNGALSKVN